MSRGKILRLKSEMAAVRAMSQIAAIPSPPRGAPSNAGGYPIGYRLTPGFNGGDDPEAEHCASWSFGKRRPTSDCIGLALWASGIDRMQPDYKGSRGHWLNCKSLVADADGEQRFCRPLRTGEVEQPGDWLLTDEHIGVVIRRACKPSKLLVVDCSPRHGRETAINIGGPWSKSCRVVRPLVYA